MYKNDGIVRRYSEGFKLKILAELSTGNYSKKQLGEIYGINRTTINEWIKKYNRKDLMNTRILVETQDETTRIKALQKEIKQLKELLIKKDLDKLVMDSYLEVAAEKLGYKSVEELKKNLNIWTWWDRLRKYDTPGRRASGEPASVMDSTGTHIQIEGAETEERYRCREDYRTRQRGAGRTAQGRYQKAVRSLGIQIWNDGFCYLALITDMYSRKIVGYDISDSLELSGCLRALNKALKHARQPTGLVHHSDRGFQYCSNQYVDELKKRDIKISMTEENHCYENAIAERVNGILKDEFYLDQTFFSKRAASMATNNAIFIYNNKRLHISLGYKTPNMVFNNTA